MGVDQILDEQSDQLEHTSPECWKRGEQLQGSLRHLWPGCLKRVNQQDEEEGRVV